jgi:hypothetical protein
MFKLSIKNSKGNYDITKLVESTTMSGDYQQCARTLGFSPVSSYTDKNIPVVAFELGSLVRLENDSKTLFEGFIFERQKDTGSSIINNTCYDRGIYLKRNEGTYKFKNTTPEAITRRLCSDFGIQMGSLASTGIKISRNFIGVSLYKIIQTAYTLASEQNGKHYIIRFSGSKLNVFEKKINNETLIIEGGSNLMSASTTESISNMINQVAIYNAEDKLIGTIKDADAIKLYGLMQSYIKQSKGEDVSQKAKNLILDNGISQKISIDNLGNHACLTGGTVVVREPYTGIYGLFYIDSDIHTWKKGQYYNKLTLNFKNIMDEQEAGSLPNKNGEKTKGETWKYINE